MLAVINQKNHTKDSFKIIFLFLIGNIFCQVLSQVLSYSEFFNHLRPQMTLGYLPGLVHSELRLLTWKKFNSQIFCDGGRLPLAYELLVILEFPDGTL